MLNTHRSQLMFPHESTNQIEIARIEQLAEHVKIKQYMHILRDLVDYKPRQTP